jgi:prepilin-type processing-associated H-X9-DG protein
MTGDVAPGRASDPPPGFPPGRIFSSSGNFDVCSTNHAAWPGSSHNGKANILFVDTSNPPARQTGWPPQKLPAAGGTTITNPIRRVEAALTLGKAMSYSGAASVASPTGHPRRVCGSQLCLSPGKHERPSQVTSRSTQSSSRPRDNYRCVRIIYCRNDCLRKQDGWPP